MKNLLLLTIALVSFEVSAQRFEVGTDSKKINIKQNSSRFELDMKIPVYRIDRRLVTEQTTCYRNECDNGNPGDGSRGNWHSFFNVPKPQKAAALAAAVKGIGVSTAEKIVEKNLLTHKPDSWSEFSSLMYRIESQLKASNCGSTSGSGSSGNWHGFFNVPKEQKPASLAAAIKGIGRSTAQKIVDNNLLTHKPDSWSEFSSLMYRIEAKLKALGYDAAFAETVVSSNGYGEENRKNLGYGSSSNACDVDFAEAVVRTYGYENKKSLGYEAQAPACHPVAYACTHQVMREFKTFSHNLDRHYSVSVRDQLLQSFENDIVVVKASENVSVSLETGHNNYKGTILNDGEIELTGSRIMRAFPVSVASATFSKTAANKLNLQVSVPEQYFNGEDAGELQMVYEVCKINFFGGCGKVVGGPFVVKFTGPVVNRQLEGNLGRGSYRVNFQMMKTGSQFYSNGKSEEVHTNKVRL